MLFTLIAFAVALGILITFHELGHYWVARLCGVRVLRFSVGFGRVLARRVDKHGTEWAVSTIPLGGYVKMQDDPEPGASPGEAARAFNTQPVGRRFAIVAAGPVFNLVLAVLLYTALNLAGNEMPAPVLSQPAAGSPAERAGFAAGDRIVAVDGQPVQSWDDVRWQLLDLLTSGGQVEIGVKAADGGPRQHILALGEANRMDPSQGDPLAEAGLTLAQPRPVVREVLAGSAGERAGLQRGDLIVSVGGPGGSGAKPAGGLDVSTLIGIIQRSAGEPLPLVVSRGGAQVSITVTPHLEKVDGQEIGRIGVQMGGDVQRVMVRYGLLESLQRGASRTWDMAWLSLRMMGRMVIGEVSWRNVSGPVTIADYAGQTARLGLAAYVAYLALISISLGVLNLLPIPMLDGGHLMFYLLEIVRGGRPLSERWIELSQRAGIGLLACLMGLALFNDFARLFT